MLEKLNEQVKKYQDKIASAESQMKALEEEFEKDIPQDRMFQIAEKQLKLEKEVKRLGEILETKLSNRESFIQGKRTLLNRRIIEARGHMSLMSEQDKADMGIGVGNGGMTSYGDTLESVHLGLVERFNAHRRQQEALKSLYTLMGMLDKTYGSSENIMEMDEDLLAEIAELFM